MYCVSVQGMQPLPLELGSALLMHHKSQDMNPHTGHADWSHRLDNGDQFIDVYL